MIEVFYRCFNSHIFDKAQIPEQNVKNYPEFLPNMG